MSDKTLMLGNEAIARGVFEAGVSVASSYPGTPSTEITEFISKYDRIFSEWAPNEKVALEVAVGASIAGARSVSAMKHVGLNVAADPLFTASYTGVNGGLVICVADDPGMHSSQNEQDTRRYAIGAKLPLVEPSDSQECKDFVKAAFELSEEFDTPVILRLTTRVAHSQSLVKLEDEIDLVKKPYIKDAGKYVMMPAMARVRHVFVEERTNKLATYAETSALNRVEYGDKNIGIITSGVAYQYAREAFGDNASYLKLGLINPLPKQMILDFTDNVSQVFIIEELEPVIEEFCKIQGIKVIGKEIFSLLGEYDANIIKNAINGYLGQKTTSEQTNTEPLPARPPVMCAGCPHRGVFFTLREMGLKVSGDIGCYTLGALAPFSSMDACVCMGASVSMAHGMEKAGLTNVVAVIGDSTFIHSGITGLIDIVYNKGNSTVIILDNSITGMTGHQQNPTTGHTIKGEPTKVVNLELLCKAVGVSEERIRVVDAFDSSAIKLILKEELAANEPSVIIARRPCALLKSVNYGLAFDINDKCKNCGACIKAGCPAISKLDGNVSINSALCVGCGYCVQLCKFGAIERR